MNILHYQRLLIMLKKYNMNKTNNIAVIWISCEFPWATNHFEFWENIKNWTESISHIDKSNIDNISDNKLIKSYWQIDNIDKFDAWFFNFSEYEVRIMDPQQRLFLEKSHQALEDAGYDFKNLNSVVWVFWWCWLSTYLFNNILNKQNELNNWNTTFLESIDTFKYMIWNDKDYLCTRVSYKLNLTWPSYSVQSACSSSLLSVHQAIKSINNWECNMAIAWWVNIVTPQSKWYKYEEGIVFSKDWYCKPFSTESSWTVFWNWVWIVVLKNLDEAIKDNDNIYAIINWSWISNDWWNRAWYSAPSIVWQEKAINLSIKNAWINIEDIEYIEAHWTATQIWDMIEYEALKRVFKWKKSKCAIWSIKSNIWHLTWSAWIAWLIKTIMCLKHNIIPKEIYSDSSWINDNSDIFYSSTETTKWSKNISKKRFCWISSFWYWWTNVHLTLSSYNNWKISNNLDNWNILLMSAKTEQDLELLRQSYLEKIKILDDNLNDFCFTACTWRTQYNQRLWIVFSSKEDLIRKLTSNNYLLNNDNWKTVFMFTGYWCEYQKMWLDLYNNFESFRRKLDEIDKIWIKELWFSIKEILFWNKSWNYLKKLKYSWLAIVSYQISLSFLLIQIWVLPSFIIWHSLGEYSWLYISWMMELDEIIKIVYFRWELLDSIQKEGLMLSIFRDIEFIDNNLDLNNYKNVSIAAINSSNQTILSWSKNSIENIIKKCDLLNIKTKILNVKKPWHSPLIDEIIIKFYSNISLTKVNEPSIPFISSLTLRLLKKDDLSIDYLTKHLRKTVNFKGSLELSHNLWWKFYIEIWTKNILSNIANTVLSWKDITVSNFLNFKQNNNYNILFLLSELYNNWYNININNYYKDILFKWNKVSIPWYPLNKKSYWIWNKDLINNKLNNFYKLTWNKNNNYFNELNTSNYSDNLFFISSSEENFDNLLFKKYFDTKINKWKFFSTNEINYNKQYYKVFDDINGSISIIYYFTLEGKDIAQKWLNYTKNLLLLIKIIASNNSNLWYYNHKITIITKNCCSILKDDVVSDNFQSSAYWIQKVLSLELLNIDIKVIDIDDLNFYNLDKVIKSSNSNNNYKQIGIRNWICYLPKIHKVENIKKKVSKLSNFKSYIIIWGWWGIWLKTIELLINLWAKKIIVIWRKSNKWDKIKNIEKKYNDINITYISCDIWNKLNLLHIFKKLSSKNNIWWIIHSAWVVYDKTFLNLSINDIDISFIPKVNWTLNIKYCIDKLNLNIDFLILFSSLTSLLWNAWQINHAISNSYLDNFCNTFNKQWIPTTTINWWAWKNVWELKWNYTILEKLENIWIIPFNSEKWINALKNIILWNYLWQISFAALNWERINNSYWNKNNNIFSNFIVNKNNNIKDNKKNNINFLLKRLLKKLLYKDIKNNENFFEAWMDSLTSIQFRNSIQEQIWVQLPFNLCYEYSTIIELEEYLKSIIIDSNKRIYETKNNLSINNKKKYINHDISKQQKRRTYLIDKWYWRLLVPIIFNFNFNKEAYINSLSQILEEDKILSSIITKKWITILNIKNLINKISSNIFDISNKSNIEKEKFLIERKEFHYNNPPNYNIELPWRIDSIVINKNTFIILIFLNHLEFDWTSISIFTNKLRDYYINYIKGNTIAVNKNAVSYFDFIEWQKNYLLSKDYILDNNFFKNYYSSLKKIPVLPWLTSIKYVPYLSKCFSINVSDSLETKLKEIWIKYGVSIFSIMTLAYSYFLSEFMNTKKVLFWTIANWRPINKFDYVIWSFVNHYPVYLDLNANSIQEQLLNIHNFIMNINMRCRYPTSDLIKNVDIFSKEPKNTYFADAYIMMNNYLKEENNIDVNVLESLWPIGQQGFKWLETKELKEMVWLFLIIDFFDWWLRCNFWYQFHRFSDETINEWTKIYMDILKKTINKLR